MFTLHPKTNTRQRLCAACLLAAAFLLPLFIGSGCSRAHSEAVAESAVARREGERVYLPEASPLRARLAFETVREEERAFPLRFVGQLAPAPQRQARVFAPFPGRVIEVHVQLGQTVAAGEPLVTLHSPEAVAVRGEFLSTRRALNVAERKLARQRDLFAHRVAAARDVEEAEAELAQARADHEAVLGQLALMGLTPEAVAERGAEPHLVVRAPQPGRVAELDVSEGELWREVGAPLGAVADFSVLWLIVEIPEKDLAKVVWGESASSGGAAPRVEARVSAYPGEVFSGEVVSLGEVVSSETRTATLRVALPNADGRLSPGMFASVELAGAPKRGVSVPVTALVQRGSETIIYEEVALGVLEARGVRLLGAESRRSECGERCFITGGLKAGAKILTSNGVLLP